MPNGSDYVTWTAFREHEEKSDGGFDRLARLEAEVMGDQETKRPSLRVEFIREITKTRKTITWLFVGVILELAAKWIWEYVSQ